MFWACLHVIFVKPSSLKEINYLFKQEQKSENETPVDPRSKNHPTVLFSFIPSVHRLDRVILYNQISLEQWSVTPGLQLKGQMCKNKITVMVVVFKTLKHNEGYFAHVHTFIHTCRKIPIHITLRGRAGWKIKYSEGKGGTRLSLPWSIYLVPIQTYLRIIFHNTMVKSPSSQWIFCAQKERCNLNKELVHIIVSSVNDPFH